MSKIIEMAEAIDAELEYLHNENKMLRASLACIENELLDERNKRRKLLAKIKNIISEELEDE